MAKTAVTKQEEQPTAVAIPDDVLSQFGQDAGVGFENVTSKDLAIPFYGVLQALSPQVKRGPQNIEGAREGDILNTVTQEVVPGDVGIIIVPCAFQKMWVEWVPRDDGGGFVAQHPTDAILKDTSPNPKSGRPMRPNGNDIVETAYHYIVRVMDGERFERAIISMTSTQLKKSRRWMAQQMNLQVKVGDRMINPPPYSHMYHLKTMHEEKDSYSWFGWQVLTPPDPLKSLELYTLCKKFAQDVMEGAVKVMPPVEEFGGDAVPEGAGKGGNAF